MPFRFPQGKPCGYHIGHRYATCTRISVARYDVRLRHSRVAMTYVVALGASPMNAKNIKIINKI
jgi:hypothetical protein